MGATIRRRKDLLEALGDKFTVGDGCWEWTGALTASGYAEIRRTPKTLRVHRVMYELFVGPIPEGLVLDHLCRNLRCVRPAHLEPVTQRENLARGISRSAQTHCANGHEFTSDNTYVRPSRPKWRVCRTCRATNRKKRVR